jgi:hypothetical protein
MDLELKLDGALLYRSTIPICQAPRESTESQGESKKISFVIQPRRTIRWSGYRDDAPTTRAKQPLKVDLWQSGADPNDLLIGMSVSNGRQIYMNSIHIAYPNKQSSTEMEKGLTIDTHPVVPAI